MTAAQRRWRHVTDRLSAWTAGALVVLFATLACAWAREGFDEEMRAYKETEPTGPVARLQRQVDQGEVRLDYDAAHGYLPAVLRELKLTPSSQLLVASKTSPNKALISPKTPRALYHNENASVAYVPGADLLEIAAFDPRLGVVFYTLEQKRTERPHFSRDDRCLECHASAKTMNVPGYLVRSFLTKDDGEVDVLSGLMVNQRTPIAERWGGYYVTGTHGMRHRGNVFGAQAIARHQKDPSYNAVVEDLSPFLPVARYPAASSDIVALLVLEHQVHLQNLLTLLSYETARVERNGGNLREIHPVAESLLKYLLFVDEARLAGPVKGTSGFAREFEAEGPKDPLGRGLRQFDLQTRLFKYPCSYMIYSPSFASLPFAARKRVYHRLWEILTGEDTTEDYRSLGVEARRAVLEILTRTQSNLPAYWKL